MEETNKSKSQKPTKKKEEESSNSSKSSRYSSPPSSAEFENRNINTMKTPKRKSRKNFKNKKAAASTKTVMMTIDRHKRKLQDHTNTEDLNSYRRNISSIPHLTYTEEL